MTATITLPSGAVVRHASQKRYIVCAETGTGAHRITSRDDLSPAVNAYYAAKLKNPAAALWLIDAETGAVLRPFVTVTT